MVEREILPGIYQIAHSPLLSGAALESMLAFFEALVMADNQIATHVVPSLVISVEKAPKADASPTNVSKCVAQVVKSQQGVAAGTIAEYSKHIKVSDVLVRLGRSLLILINRRPARPNLPSLSSAFSSWENLVVSCMYSAYLFLGTQDH